MSGSKMRSLERLLQDPQTRQRLNRSVVILDEAEWFQRDRWPIFFVSRRSSPCELSSVAMTKHIQSVEAGDALRILEKESKLKTVALTQVQRQTKKDYRDAIQELRHHPERGFAQVGCNRSGSEVSSRIGQRQSRSITRSSGVELLWSSVRLTMRSIESRKQYAITGRRLVNSGKASPSSVTFRLAGQRRRRLIIRTFDLARLWNSIARSRASRNTNQLEVVRADDDGIVVRTTAGIERTLTGKQANSFDVMEEKPIEIAPGDRLLLTANRREERLRTTNGELVTVSAVDSAGRVHLQDGRTLPANYRSLAHGYAVTAHRSQGKTVDSVIISADGMRKELFYVAASRGRENITVITSDKERLTQTVAQTAARKSASELVRGSHHRGISMARQTHPRCGPVRHRSPRTAGTAGAF